MLDIKSQLMTARSKSIVSVKKVKAKMVREKELVAEVAVEAEVVVDVVAAAEAADQKVPHAMKAKLKTELEIKEKRGKKDHVEEMVVPEEAQTDQTPLTLDLRKSEKVARGSIMVAMVSAEEVVREAIVQEPLQVDRKLVLQDADVADTEAVTKKEVSVVAVVDTKDPVMVAKMEMENAVEVEVAIKETVTAIKKAVNAVVVMVIKETVTAFKKAVNAVVVVVIKETVKAIKKAVNAVVVVVIKETVTTIKKAVNAVVVADTEAETKKVASVVAVEDTKDPVMVASMEISNAAEVVVDVAVATAELQEVLTMETKLQCEKAVKPCHSLRVLMIEALSSKLTSKFQ